MSRIDRQTTDGILRAFRGPAVAGDRLIIRLLPPLRVRAVLAVSFLNILMAAGSLSAAANGALSGTILGPTRNPISGAKITLAASEGSCRSVITDQQGHYSFPSVEPATYVLSAEAVGYEAITRVGIRITAETSTTVDLLLPVVGATEAKVTAALPDYYDDTPLKASAVTSATDEPGYSSQAQSPRRLLTEGPSLADSIQGMPRRKPRTPETAETERELREVLQTGSDRFEANHQMGEFYLSVGDWRRGIPYLEKAQGLKPGDYSNGYDLAAAYLAANDPAKAQTVIQDLGRHQDTAELHNLSGKIDEALGDSAAAVKEFELAAHMAPREDSLFAWGNELLLHENISPALEVFRRGTSLFPQSSRMYIGLGLALYSHNSYDAAIEALCRASDLDPSDPRPYVYLGKMYNSSAGKADEVAERMRRFMQTNPENAYAYYYSALSLWRAPHKGEEGADTSKVEALLKESAARDPRLADPHLQLGVLYQDLHREEEAIGEFQTAIRLRPEDPDAHYRLAQAYLRAGDKSRSQEEFQVYDRLHKQQPNQMNTPAAANPRPIPSERSH